MTLPLAREAPSGPAVLTKAVENAAQLLGLTDRELAAVLGVSPASVSRLSRGVRQIEPASKEGELALLFLRVFRSLDGLLGGTVENARRWLHAPNHHLGGVPAELVQSARGLVHVGDYLDAFRGQG